MCYEIIVSYVCFDDPTECEAEFVLISEAKRFMMSIIEEGGWADFMGLDHNDPDEIWVKMVGEANFSGLPDPTNEEKHEYCRWLELSDEEKVQAYEELEHYVANEIKEETE